MILSVILLKNVRVCKMSENILSKQYFCQKILYLLLLLHLHLLIISNS